MEEELSVTGSVALGLLSEAEVVLSIVNATTTSRKRILVDR
jgi:hypothetical protein